MTQSDSIGGASPPLDHNQVLQEALKDVVQELVIQHDGEQHIVYIHGVSYNNGLQIDYSTDSKLPIIGELVNKAVQAQITEIESQKQLTRKQSALDTFLDYIKLKLTFWK